MDLSAVGRPGAQDADPGPRARTTLTSNSNNTNNYNNKKEEHQNNNNNHKASDGNGSDGSAACRGCLDLGILLAVCDHKIDILQKLSMSKRKGSGKDRDFGNVDYTQLTETDNGFVDSQFVHPTIRVPWKAITLATLLFLGGTVMLIIGTLLVSGHIDSKYSDRMWPVIILGALMFIPGAYHVRMAIQAYRRVPGYSFDDIPEFE